MQLSSVTVKQILAVFWRTKYAPRIIYHHSVHPSDAFALRPWMFREQIQWLRDERYCFHLFSTLIQGCLRGSVSDRAVSITFDDGYLDNYEYAFPILDEYRIPATFFVVSAMVGHSSRETPSGYRLYEGRRMMSRYHLEELVASGMEVGSHTRSHVHLKSTLAYSYSRALDETAGSKKELEDMLGHEVITFAYPNGQKGVFDASTRLLLEQAGYRYAATTIWGYVSAACDPLQVSRMEIKAEDSLDTFCAKMSGRYDFMRLIHLIRDGARQRR